MKIPIKIKFDNASLIVADKKNPYATNDYYITLNDCLNIYKKEYHCTPRNDSETLVMPNKENLIVISPIVGMLHAILGEIPPKRFGGFGIEPIQKIVDCVYNGVMKITNDYFYHNKNEEEVLITEIARARKANKYSRPKTPQIRKDYANSNVEVHFTWVGLWKRFMVSPNKNYNYVTYNEFLDKLESLSGVNCRNNSIEFSEVFDIIRNDINKSEELGEFLTERGYTMYVKFLKDKSYDCASTRFNNATDGIMVSRYIQERVYLNGEFVFWIDKDMYDRLLRGPRSCTYLDGGIAYLSNDTCYTYDFYIDNDYIPIKNLKY